MAQENVRIINILLRNWCHNNKHFSELSMHHGIMSLSPYALLATNTTSK